MIPRTGEAILEANRVLGQAYRDAGLPYNQYFAAPACWHYRAFIMISSLPVSRLDPEINRRSRAAFEHIAKVAAEHGWGEYRSPPFGVDFVLGAYSFNDHALRRFCETLEGRRRSERHHRGGARRDLAETPAGDARMRTTISYRGFRSRGLLGGIVDRRQPTRSGTGSRRASRSTTIGACRAMGRV